MIRTYWLSFVHPARGFLGATLVEVDEEDAEAMRDHLRPHSRPGAEWVLAAAHEATLMGCNPGGEYLASEVDATKLPATATFNRLLTQAEALALREGASS